MAVHVVKTGDCITSIADHYGFFWETVWKHENNAALRAIRSDPHTLIQGDRVFVPDLRAKEVVCNTGNRHRFRRKGIPALLRLQLFDGMKPRDGQTFSITLDTGPVLTGSTDADGILCVALPTKARSGKLVIGPDQFTVELALGGLAPIETIEGAQARLQNLGFYAGRLDGKESEALAKATSRFQTAYGLPATGTIDEATRRLLDDMHDQRERDPARIDQP